MHTIELTTTKLDVAPENVRKAGTGDLDELAASIKAHGLIHPLTVRKDGKKYAVIAGSRRLAAIQHLIDSKALPKLFKVPCIEYTGNNATDVSLAENVTRLPMHPADQFEAFKSLSDADKSNAEIAAAFGVTETIVKKRLKLAGVHASIFEAFRKDDINLETIMAYTLTDDLERQNFMFEQNPDMASWQIRKALTENEVRHTDPRVKLIDVADYEKAGGRIRTDLFSDDMWLLDPDILEECRQVVVTEAIEQVRAEGWGEVAFYEDMDNVYKDFPNRVYPRPVELNKTDQKKLDKLSKQYDTLAEQWDNGDGSDEIEVELSDLQVDIDKLTDKQEAFQPDDIAASAAILTLDYQGTLNVYRGMQRKGSKSKDMQDEAPAKPAISAKLGSNLDAIRTATIARDMSDNVLVGMAAITYSMALNIFYPDTENGLYVAALNRRVADHIETPEQLACITSLQKQFEQWRNALPDEPDALWTWCLNAGLTKQSELLTFIAAISLDACSGYSDERKEFADKLAGELDTDPARHVTLSELGYFHRVSKAQILNKLPAPKNEAWAGLKKGDLAEKATVLLDGKWLPPQLASFSPVEQTGEHCRKEQETTPSQKEAA